jgi:hypothetical protein
MFKYYYTRFRFQRVNTVFHAQEISQHCEKLSCVNKFLKFVFRLLFGVMAVSNRRDSSVDCKFTDLSIT